ncbi:MAG: hypothetical protein ABSB69_03730 [Solirubrobacteraceae bacterium]
MKRTLAPLQPTGRAQPPATHPLLGAFPLAVMAVAALLVLFMLTMARLNAGEDSPLRPSTSTSFVSASQQGERELPGAGSSRAASSI